MMPWIVVPKAAHGSQRDIGHFAVDFDKGMISVMVMAVMCSWSP